MIETLKRFKLQIIVLLIIIISIPITFIQLSRQQETRSRATGSPISLNLNPLTSSQQLDTQFDVALTINTNTNNVSALDITITYNSKILTLVSFTPASTFSTITNDSSTRGTLHYVGVNPTSSPITGGAVSIGSLKFQGVTAGTASVGFSNIQATAQGQSGLLPIDTANTRNGSYVIITTPAPTYTISGNVFVDTNGNGEKDGQESNYVSIDNLTLRTGSCNGTLIGTASSASTSPGYTFSELANGTTYYIVFRKPTSQYNITIPTNATLCSGSSYNHYVTRTISGANVSQNWGIQPVSTSTPTPTPTTVPTATPTPTPTPTGTVPSNFTFTSVCSGTDSQMILSWTANSAGGIQTIKRCEGPGCILVDYTTVGSTVATYTYTGLLYITVYRHQVCNSFGCSSVAFGLSNSCPLPTQPPTPQPTIPPGTTSLSLSITLTGIGVSQNPALGINNNPRRPARNVQAVLINSDNQQVATFSATVNFDSATGRYRGNIGLGNNFISGSYLVKVRLDNTLWKTIPGIQNITSGQIYNAPQAALVSGDIIQNNEINLLDYNALLSCYGARACTTKVQADANDDGKVDELDLNILYAGFARRVGD